MTLTLAPAILGLPASLIVIAAMAALLILRLRARSAGQPRGNEGSSPRVKERRLASVTFKSDLESRACSRARKAVLLPIMLMVTLVAMWLVWQLFSAPLPPVP